MSLDSRAQISGSHPQAPFVIRNTPRAALSHFPPRRDPDGLRRPPGRTYRQKSLS
jgi:hypothetical protein